MGCCRGIGRWGGAVPRMSGLKASDTFRLSCPGVAFLTLPVAAPAVCGGIGHRVGSPGVAFGL